MSEPASELLTPEEPAPAPSPNPPIGWALARLLAVVAAGVLLAVVLHAVGVLVVVLALVLMVMAHEAGHFATAKWSGMKVTEYFFGFGPRLWSLRRGETEYGVKAIPAGGYVKITGMTMLEDVAPDDEPRSYRQASFPRRVLVASAGSIVHFILAFVLVWAAFTFVGTQHAVRPYVAGLLSFQGSKTPAQLAGIHPGDHFLSVNGRPVTDVNALVAEVNRSAGRPLQVTVERGGRQLTLTVTPVDGRGVTELGAGGGERYRGSKPIGIIGVTLGDSVTTPVNPVTAVPRAGAELGSLVAGTGQSLAQVFSLHGLRSFVHQVATAGSSHSGSTSGSATGGGSGSGASAPTICSIVCAVQIGSQEAGQSIAGLLLLLAEINLFVGIVNLFPMLPLDGGHVAIAVYERLRSRRGMRYHADITKLMPVAYVFLAFIVLLGLGALYANILQPAHLPGG